MPLVTPAFVARIIMKGLVVSEQSLNVFYYGSPTLTDPLDELANAFITHFSPLWQGITSSGALWQTCDVQMLKGSGAFTSVPVGVSGGVSGDCLPPYAAWDFTLVRGGLGERNGYKRFAGVSETSQVNGVATGAILSGLAAMAAGLNVAIDTTTDEWSPVIRRTRVNKVIQNPPVYYSFIGATYSRIGTQNSRKFGHGR